MIKDTIKKIRNYGIRQSLAYGAFEAKRMFLNRLILKSYSLDLEDTIIDRLCGYKKNGYYVDVGACDPTRLSNTRRFYEKGWSGINIEANPMLIEAFNQKRPRDKNINCGIGLNEHDFFDFYVMFPPTLSTFSKDFMEMNVLRGNQNIRTERVQLRKLASVLDEHLPKGTEIDFLSVDAEGHDFDVLQSNDWVKYRPKVVVVESVTQFHPSPVPNNVYEQYQFLNKQGYDLAFHNGMDSFYVRK